MCQHGPIEDNVKIIRGAMTHRRNKKFFLPDGRESEKRSAVVPTGRIDLFKTSAKLCWSRTRQLTPSPCWRSTQCFCLSSWKWKGSRNCLRLMENKESRKLSWMEWRAQSRRVTLTSCMDEMRQTCGQLEPRDVVCNE